MNGCVDHDRVRRREDPTPLDFWLRRALREQWGQVAREPVPQNLLALLDETVTEH